jgi:short-subunit dehydrogenase
MRLSNKTILITGAGNGMGQQLVIEAINRGAKVVAIDLDKRSLTQSKKLAKASDTNFYPIVLDITDSKKIAQLPKQIATKFHPVDILINNAGIIQSFVKINQLDQKAIDKVMAVNFTAPLALIKAFLPSLIAKNSGHIVNTSSMGAYAPVPGQSLYGASKAALAALTAGLWSELLDTKVGVTTVFPGAIQTNIAKNSGVKIAVSADASKIKMTQASVAAKLILDAVEKNKARVFIGRDAKLMNFLTRVNPLFAAKLIQKQMRDLLK